MPRSCGVHLSRKDKSYLCELYKCHFTIAEAMEELDFSYNTIRMYYHGFGMMEIMKYNRKDLMPKEIQDDAECDTRQTIIN